MATTLVSASAESAISYKISESDATFPAPGTKSNDLSKNFNPAGSNSAVVATKVYAKTHSLSGGASVSIDLSGSLTDPFGNAVVFTKVKFVRIYMVDSGSSSGILIDNSVTNAFSVLNAALKLGGWIDICIPTTAGIAIANGSTDILKITNSDGSNAATVQVEIFGE